MPPLSAASRMQGRSSPAKKNRWRCPTCGAFGWAKDAHAAYLAGTRHFTDEHDPKEDQ